MTQKTSSWKTTAKMKMLLAMEMRKHTIYLMLVLQSSFLVTFWKTYQPTRDVWSNSAFPSPQTSSSQKWIPREIFPVHNLLISEIWG